MAASALLIYGTVSEALLKPRPLPRSLLDRLLGRTRTIPPAWVEILRDRRIIDLPCDELQALAGSFLDHVAKRFDPKSTATSSILDYLALGVTEVLVRGDASGTTPPEWYVQVTFRGCAGMAETSAELAAHWAELWYRSEQGGAVAALLRRYGFEPNGRLEPDRSSTIFVPFGIAGYAVFNPTPREPDEEYVESRYFDIDNSALETLDDSERADALRRIDEEIPRLLPGSCCCQWCAPGFDAAAVERFTPFK